MRVLRRFVVGLAVYGCAAAFWSCSTADSPNPSFASAGELQPVQPAYVGKHVCKECHRKNFELHSRHGHAATFASTREPEIAAKFMDKTFDAGDEFGEFTYGSDENGLYVQLRDKLGDKRFPLPFALGSGHVGITPFTLMPHPEFGTVGIEHRASWMNATNQLAATPGQRPDRVKQSVAELFGERHEGVVMHKCVYCHTTTANIVGSEIHDLVASVNCEKCHGPGSVHVQQARESDSPPPFSVGRKEWNVESEIQLCGDCHRLPKTISPQRLREYPNALTRFQPVGLLRSNCYLKSGRRLKCTTCHSPHQSVNLEEPTTHVKNCLACHDQSSSKHTLCPVSPKDGCIECHMPIVELEDGGLKFHDHWIRVRGDHG